MQDSTVTVPYQM